jgi:serine/threonine protein kinase/tetratricopeptide (TPR) repeat protein
MPNVIWNRAKEIFETLVNQPESERTVFLHQACGTDAELRASVQKLLAAHERAGEFLREPTLNADTLIQMAERSRSALGDRSGGRPGKPESGEHNDGAQPSDSDRRIGRYKLLEVIGEGGFGAVYMAEQTEPVRRRVALKIIRPGMDSRPIVARFEAERQALALMDHANIARVLDGGETDAGRPYFVMELVRGIPITQFCDQQRLAMRERLDLFVQVCHAVQHAHQKGIIHRDIKPSNVLVTLHDGKPVPKVIDFGIAKAMHTPLTEKTLFTEFRQLIGTPTYMSPEQAEMSGLDVDTRSDIYSLGVLLYELLTGSTPFDVQKLLNAGYAELQRTIKEVEPPRPSTRVSSAVRTTSRRIEAAPVNSTIRALENAHAPPGGSGGRIGASTINDIAHFRRTDPHSLFRLLRGDLDWIVMKCLEKDRSRRFGTASDLALDLDRYLRDEPISARPPSSIYRLKKLARRNRTAFIAAGAILLALGAGFAVSIAGFVAARSSQHLAEQQKQNAEINAGEARRAAARAEAVNKFLQEMLASADPSFAGASDISVRAALDKAVAQLDAGAIKGQLDVVAGLRMTIGRAYAGLALFDAAQVQLEAAVSSTRALYGEDHAEYAAALHKRGTLQLLKSNMGGAEVDMRAALEINRRRLDPQDLRLAANLNDLATCIMESTRLDQRDQLLNEALRIVRLPQNADDPLLGDVLNNLGHAPKIRGEWERAEALFREALAVNRRLRGDVHAFIATNLDNLAQIRDSRGDVDEAEALYREALDIRRRLYKTDHPELATTLHNLAGLLWRKGDRDAAEESVRESLQIFRNVHGLAHMDTLVALDSLVAVVGGTGRLDEAEALLLESFEAIKDHPQIPASRKASTAKRLAELYTVRNQQELAQTWKQTADQFSGGGP